MDQSLIATAGIILVALGYSGIKYGKVISLSSQVVPDGTDPDATWDEENQQWVRSTYSGNRARIMGRVYLVVGVLLLLSAFSSDSDTRLRICGSLFVLVFLFHLAASSAKNTTT